MKDQGDATDNDEIDPSGRQPLEDLISEQVGGTIHPTRRARRTKRLRFLCERWKLCSRSAGVRRRRSAICVSSTGDGPVAASSKPRPVALNADSNVATVGFAPGRSSRAMADWVV